MAVSNERRMQFAIGVVTLIAAFALAVIIIWFSDFQYVIQPKTTYFLLFKYAPGLEPKIPVRRAGIRIGEVKTVEYSDEWSVVAAKIEVEGDNDLREGDEPTLQRGFLGDTHIEIEVNPTFRGKANRTKYPSGTTFDARSPFDPLSMMSSGQELIPNANKTMTDLQHLSGYWSETGQRVNRILEANEKQITQILEQTRQSMETLATTLESINNVLDKDTQDNLRTTVKNLRELSDDLKPLVDSSKEAIDQIASTTGRLDDVAQNLQIATKPLAERSANTMENLDKSVETLGLLLTDLRGLTGQLQREDGSFQKLLKDPALYQNLDDASFMLVKNLNHLDTIMKDLKVFSDKIARHPGELGIQGVFTKDKGLKTIPPESLDTSPQRH